MVSPIRNKLPNFTKAERPLTCSKRRFVCSDPEPDETHQMLNTFANPKTHVHFAFQAKRPVKRFQQILFSCRRVQVATFCCQAVKLSCQTSILFPLSEVIFEPQN